MENNTLFKASELCTEQDGIMDHFLPDMELIDFDKFDVDIEKKDGYPFIKFTLKFGQDTSKGIGLSKRGLYKLFQHSQTLV